MFCFYDRNFSVTKKGQPTSMSFDPLTSRFQLVFNVNIDIHQPTIVYINEELNYPKGFDINVSPADSLTWNSTSSNYYEFTPTISTKNGTSITIQISQKQLNWLQRTWNSLQHTWNWLKSVICFWKK
jgi:hypothetical protein